MSLSTKDLRVARNHLATGQIPLADEPTCPMTPVDDLDLRLGEFLEIKSGDDEKFAVVFKTYCGRLHGANGDLFESSGDRMEARRRYERALRLLKDNREFRPIPEEALRRMTT